MYLVVILFGAILAVLLIIAAVLIKTTLYAYFKNRRKGFPKSRKGIKGHEFTQIWYGEASKISKGPIRGIRGMDQGQGTPKIMQEEDPVEETKKQCHFLQVFENGEAKSVYADSMSAAIEHERNTYGWAIIGIWLAEPVDLSKPKRYEPLRYRDHLPSCRMNRGDVVCTCAEMAREAIERAR